MFNALYRLFLILFLAIMLLAVPACEPRKPDAPIDRMAANAFEQRKVDFYLHISLDLSGSFLDLMERGGKAHEYVLRLISHFFRRASEGEHDWLIITQLSATDTAIVFEGTSESFKRMFPTGDDFIRHLRRKSNPAGSRVFDSISDGLEKMLDSPAIEKGHTRFAMIVLSDFEDNLGKKDSHQRLVKGLQRFNTYGGMVGFYYVRHDLVRSWEQALKTCGFPPNRMRVTAEFTAETPLPSF